MLISQLAGRRIPARISIGRNLPHRALQVDSQRVVSLQRYLAGLGMMRNLSCIENL
jgi:hypothetical protein